MQKYVMEFIGTFFLVLAIGSTVVEPGAGHLAPLAIGATFMVMIYAGGYISGAHYNPAVTFAVWLRGKCPSAEVPGYIASQLLASVAASLVVIYLKGGGGFVTTTPAATGIVAEFIGTFALVFVILQVATSKATAGNAYYGAAIALTVVGMAYALGGISGGAFNPAVVLGLVVMGLKAPADIWIFLVGNLSAAAAAAYTFKFLNPGDR
jgi:aquaporin Z